MLPQNFMQCFSHFFMQVIMYPFGKFGVATVFALILLFSTGFPSQETFAVELSREDRACREAIPSISLRHLRTSKFTYWDAINQQISTRYSEYLDPTFGGYVLDDELSPTVDNPSSMLWSAVDFNTGRREFSACDGGGSAFNITSGFDTWISDNILIGGTIAFGQTALAIDDHPLPRNSDETSSTDSEALTLIGGLYTAYMHKNFQVSNAFSLHTNELSIDPEGVTESSIPTQFSFSFQTGAALHIPLGAINHQIGAYVSYENLNLDPLSFDVHNNAKINYGSIDLSTITPSIRWQANSYFATENPKSFIGFKGGVIARRVFPLGPSSWAWANQTNGSNGTVSLDSEWTEIALDGTISFRTIQAREIYLKIGYKSIFAEHESQDLGGEDIKLTIGGQYLF